ncbi:MAG TPA: hypothetical protein VFR12_07455 [Pyrinomonadaceae bacterium]|nr:hypothetical protein [Pyrinomonadaceae bacterium]
MLLQQAQDRVPPSMIGGAVIAQHEVARDVDDYPFVEEVPAQPATASVNQLPNGLVKRVAFDQRRLS